MIQKLSITMAILLTLVSIAAADTIYLLDKSRLDGRVLRVTAQNIEYDPAGKKPFAIVERSTVDRIVYEDGQTIRFNQNEGGAISREEIKKPKKTIFSYPVIGVTLGTPAGLNCMTGYFFERIGLTVSGMFFGPSVLYGVQGSVLFMFKHSARTIHGISASGGYSYIGAIENDPEAKWAYGCLSYVFNYRGFHLEAGLAAGKGDFSNPQFYGQIGYLHRFNTE